MTIRQVHVTYAGLSGLPGQSTHYFTSGTTMSTALSVLHGFYDAIKGFFPAGLTVQVQGSGNELNEATGALTGTWSATTPAVVNGAAGSGRHAAGVGACVTWKTVTVGPHRFIHARSFLVPLETSSYQADGTIDGSALSTFQTAADSMVAAANPGLLAWHRPVAHAGGSVGQVTSARVPDRVCTLKTRR
jgi:hypothetical protein